MVIYNGYKEVFIYHSYKKVFIYHSFKNVFIYHGYKHMKRSSGFCWQSNSFNEIKKVLHVLICEDGFTKIERDIE